MITFYSGTPGSGKSLKAAKEVQFWLKTFKKPVISNCYYNRDYMLQGHQGGKLYYVDNNYWTNGKGLDFLYKFALKFNETGKEHQALIVWDEAQTIFSPTAVKLFTKGVKGDKGEILIPSNPQYRQQWLDFFSMHRHLGYDVLMISQFDRLIDAQVRCLFEYEYKHRKANNFRTLGQLFTILHIPLFVEVRQWYAVRGEKISSNFYTYKKKYAKFYDSYNFKDKIIAKMIKLYGPDIVEQLLHPELYRLHQLEKQQQEALLGI